MIGTQQGESLCTGRSYLFYCYWLKLYGKKRKGKASQVLNWVLFSTYPSEGRKKGEICNGAQ